MAKLCGDHLTEEQCWDYIATHMAPLTYPSDQVAGSSGVQDQQDTMEVFFAKLAANASSAPKHKVAKYIHYYILHKILK